MIIFLFLISIFKDNGNWLFVFTNKGLKGFLALVSKGKTILGPKEEKVAPG
jgi:hypothetical protein